MKSYAIIMLAALAAAVTDKPEISIKNIGGTKSFVSDFWFGEVVETDTEVYVKLTHDLGGWLNLKEDFSDQDEVQMYYCNADDCTLWVYQLKKVSLYKCTKPQGGFDSESAVEFLTQGVGCVEQSSAVSPFKDVSIKDVCVPNTLCAIHLAGTDNNTPFVTSKNVQEEEPVKATPEASAQAIATAALKEKLAEQKAIVDKQRPLATAGIMLLACDDECKANNQVVEGDETKLDVEGDETKLDVEEDDIANAIFASVGAMLDIANATFASVGAMLMAVSAIAF